MGNKSPQNEYAKFTLITKGNAVVGAHNVYSAIAIGGKLMQAGKSNPRPSLTISSNTQNDDDSYARSVDPVNSFDFGNALLRISKNPLAAAGVDFSAYEQLARIAVSSTNTVGGVIYKVIVVNQDDDTNQRYNLYDFVPGGQGKDNGKTLVIFVGTKRVVLTKTHDGRQFGPSIIAPFAHVNLVDNAGYIDGFIVAKSFKGTGSNPSQVQMHGNAFKGTLQCVNS